MGKRIFLFILTNILVVLTISLILRVFNVSPYLTAYGLNYTSLAIFALVWGMTGAFISLLLSKFMAKTLMGVKIIDPNTANPRLARLVQKVHQLAQSSGLSRMPEVGIYESHEINAFATGPSKKNSLVAVSTGLLERMDDAAIEGVLGHEVAHIANGDMVTMTLIQGIVNTFVLFLSRVIAFAILQVLRSRDDNESVSPLVYHLVSFVLEIVLMFFGMLVIAWFSRQREYRADIGGATYAGKSKMIRALQSLQNASQDRRKNDAHPAIQALQISSKAGLLQLFSTHPPLEQRIARLEQNQMLY